MAAAANKLVFNVLNITSGGQRSIKITRSNVKRGNKETERPVLAAPRETKYPH